jgi:hypothetical protein
MSATDADTRALKERIDQLEAALARQGNEPHLVAQQAFASLHFFHTHYAGGAGYEQHRQEVIRILRERGRGELNLPAGRLFSGLADLLEKTS